MSAKKEKLRKKVAEFLKAQPGHNPEEQEKLWASCKNDESCTVIYGKDEMAGIMGIGETVDLAFADFKEWEKKLWDNRPGL